MNIAVFLDRDGTVTKSTALVTSQNEIELEERAAEGIKLLNETGAKVIVVTNQPQVARGLCTESDVEKINDIMISKLNALGARIDAVYYCPHHPEAHHDDIPEHARKYRIECACRKPNIGMLEKAAGDIGINLKNSFMIGDRTVDIQAGKNAGCRTILVKTGRQGLDGKHDVSPDFISEDLYDAAKVVASILKPRIKAVILAGGRGERLMPLTKDIPKPMIEIDGKPAVQHHIELLKNSGISDIVLCVSYLSHKIKEHFGDGNVFGVNIYYPEEPQQLGSGGAIKNGAEFLGDADYFVVLSGDVMTDIDIRSVLNFHLGNRGIATLVVRESDHPKDSDVVVMEGNRIVRYIGRGQEEHKIANTGIMILSKKILDCIPEGFSNIEKNVIFPLLGKENVFGYLSDAYIKDFGTFERLESVRKKYSGLR